MKLHELNRYLENSDRVRIYRNGKEIFTGFWWFFANGNAIYKTARESDVIRFRATQEIRSRNWLKNGLDCPLHPDETADYYSRDLQIKLYYKIHIADDAQTCTEQQEERKRQ